MLNGERLHHILEPLTSFKNKSLFFFLYMLLEKIKNSDGSSNQYYTNYNVFNSFEEIYSDLVNKKIIELLIELHHFLQYQLSKGKEPYNEFYWVFIKNSNAYMKAKIIDIQKIIEDLNTFLNENKMKSSDSFVDIHITTNKFNVQLEQ